MLDTAALDPLALAAANINPTSYLATDYLNHFNEVVMLMEMIADMPDMAEDVLAWEPRAYNEHFEQSVFTDKALAIAAYNAAPRATRERFESVIKDLDAKIVDVQIMVSGLDPAAPMDPAIADRLQTTIADELRPAIDRASGIINAAGPSYAPNDVGESDEATERAQDTIDALFN